MITIDIIISFIIGALVGVLVMGIVCCIRNDRDCKEHYELGRTDERARVLDVVTKFYSQYDTNDNAE